MKKTTWVFLLLALAVSAGAYWYEFRREKKPDEETKQTPLVAFKQEEVAELRVKRAAEGAGGAILLAKGAEGWRLREPLDAAPDTSRVDSILFQLTASRFARSYPATPENLKSYGLDNPAIVLELKLVSGAAHRIEFGAKDFSQSNVYARVDGGNEVRVIPDELRAAADLPLLEYRDRRIAVFRAEELVRLRVQSAALALAAEKTAEGKWLVTAPPDRKGRELIESRVLLTLENARATQILDQPPPAVLARLRKPAVTVELDQKDGKTLRYRFAALDKDSAITAPEGSSVVYQIPAANLDSLQFKLDEVLREPPAPPAAEAPSTAGKKSQPAKPEQ